MVAMMPSFLPEGALYHILMAIQKDHPQVAVLTPDSYPSLEPCLGLAPQQGELPQEHHTRLIRAWGLFPLRRPSMN